MVGDFNTQLTSVDRSSRPKNQQGNSYLKYHIGRNGYLKRHSIQNTKMHILFNAFRMFSRIDHMLDYKTSLKTLTKIQAQPSNFSDQNSVTQEIKYMGKEVESIFKWEETRVNLWLIHVVVWQKPTQYSEVISLQIKTIFLKKKSNTKEKVLKAEIHGD